ncbi:DUF4434 family protein [Enterobacter sp. CC120223-11]|uniref:DUF4434 family protein n=1 Tax=Enterobacter sp. CC120223-11 TaxID=1378073 RepID=UPI000BD0BBFF|nr:DUF4434 family protein [Enterobacter sp. CC120223-11]SNY63028.1 protein of unknown function [Enterobacter sp. CC120223-11]
MLKLRHLLLLALLASPWANAMKAVFWQPQLRDSGVSAEQWSTLMQKLHRQGFDTLVLQWTQYGTAFADENGSQQLRQRAAAAQSAGLKVIVGLNADPEFFSRQKQSAAALKHYLGRLRVADLQQAKRWSDSPDFRPDGWYLSAEIDDLNWRSPERRVELLAWLSDTRQLLAKHDNKPVYISSFFAGNMTPEGYAAMIAEIEKLRIGVWVQDGLGVKTLNPTQRQLYLDAAAGCHATSPARGTVYEVFDVTPGKTFSAQPMAAKQMAAQLAQTSRCGKDVVWFSLRYLPAAQGILQYR